MRLRAEELLHLREVAPAGYQERGPVAREEVAYQPRVVRMDDRGVLERERRVVDAEGDHRTRAGGGDQTGRLAIAVQGRERRSHPAYGEWVDGVIYGLVREDLEP